jgi:hypothetical protein
MGKCGADTYRADDDPERHAPPFAEPAGDDLHSRRIHPREGRAGQESQDDHNRGRGRDGDRRVHEGTGHAPDREQPARIDGVGEVRDRSYQRAGDEAGLHRHGQPGEAAGRHAELPDDRRSRGGGGKP